MKLLLISLVAFLGLTLVPTQAHGKPLNDTPACVAFYLEYAQTHDVPPNWVGQKVRGNCVH